MDTSRDVVGRRVMILESGIGDSVRGAVESLGYTVVGPVTGDEEAEAVYRAAVPDLIIATIRFGHAGGIEAVSRLMEIRRRPVIYVNNTPDLDVTAEVVQAGAFACIMAPSTPAMLHSAIEIASQRFHELQTLEREKQMLSQTLETRKLVERAKGIFMRRLQLDEGEAHRRLQQESQNRRISLAELAKRVIESEDLLSGK